MNGANGKERAVIRSLPSGVRGLDNVLGGGLPEYSFNLIAGGPGSGKTTLAHQIMFANASVERPALYFTVLGEPTLKMLRYQRQFSYFDPELAGSAIQFINLSAEVMERDLGEVLQRIISEIERAKPGIVVVDSFRQPAFQLQAGRSVRPRPIRAASRPAPDHLGSNLLPPRRVRRGGAAKSRLHCGRWHTLADAGDG